MSAATATPIYVATLVDLAERWPEDDHGDALVAHLVTLGGSNG